nr:hypothetical protein [Tanacetum cinerariifolium]
MTTTTIPPPPPQPQQSTIDPTSLKCIDELEQHMVNLLQYNLALEESLDKHGSRLYKLENLNIPRQISKAVDEIVTDAINPMRLIKILYDVLEKSLERDYSDQLLSDLEEAFQKKRKRRDVPRTPSGSPPPQPSPLPPPAGASGASGSEALSLSKSVALAPQSMDWTTSDTRYESASIFETQDLSPTDSQIQDDYIPDEQVHLSDDEDSGNDHLLKADSRKDWWKPLPEEERLATLKPAWTIPSSTVSDVEKKWATTLVSAYETPAENSLLAKTGDMMNFLNWYCRQVNKTVLTLANLEWQAYETNPEGDQVRIDVNRPLPLGGSSGHVTIQTQFFFNKNLKYLRYGSKGSSLALLISKIKAASYPDFHARANKSDQPCGFSVSSELKPTLDTGHPDHLPGFDKWMLSTAVKLWTRNLVIRQRVEDFQLGIESYQTQLNLAKLGWD